MQALEAKKQMKNKENCDSQQYLFPAAAASELNNGFKNSDEEIILFKNNIVDNLNILIFLLFI